MGEIERDGDGRAAFGAEPFVAEITDRFQDDVLGGELGIKFFNARFELAAGDLEFQIADARPQQLVVAKLAEVGRRRQIRRSGGFLFA